MKEENNNLNNKNIKQKLANEKFCRIKSTIKYSSTGITIVALVITIVILLILAGVSISMLIGENSIIRQATKAREETEKASEKEQILLAYNYVQTHNLNTSVNAKDLLNQLKSNKVDVSSVIGEDLLVIIMNNNNIYEIDNTQNVNFIGTNMPFSDDEPIMMARNDEIAFWQEEYRTKITKIDTRPYIIDVENTIAKWDISQKQNKSVLAYLLDDGASGYELFIVSNGMTEINVDASNLFSDFTSLKSANFSNFNTENVTNMNGMFGNCDSLVNLDVSNFDTNKVTSTRAMFHSLDMINSIDLSNWTLENIYDMQYMFGQCKNLKYIYLNNFVAHKKANLYGSLEWPTILKELHLEKINPDNVNLGEMGINPTTKIITNAKTKQWLNTNYPKLTNIEVID